ncbi:poly polymerase 2 [Nephila pilipes]|uniref:Poly [ADP-ribose] polymerase n=1 Tax=Nephila pilipes TaxID=299642 RepID=A0A8X6QGZ9_NEPPI|nr:poly polymerase 2 [Nephila pilipes]
MTIDADEVCDFVWQYEQRKRWINYTDEQIQVLNKAVKERKTNVLLPSKNTRKQLIIDFDKMIQKNKVSRYEQKIRCLVTNSGFNVWLWKDNYEDWLSYQPYLSFYLEVAYHKQEKVLKFSSLGDFKVNFETWEQTNEETFSTNLVKRENVDLATSVEINNICLQNEIVFKKVCSDNIVSAKRLRLELPNDNSSSASGSINGNGGISIPAHVFNPLDFNESVNSDQILSSPFDNVMVPVDLECPDRENFHIYCENKTIYSATLNQTNMQNNNNKFYIIQLLEHNKRKLYSVWRRWGRVGQRGQSELNKYGSSLSEAKVSFEEKFYAKTRNDWSNLKDFVHVKGKYDLLQMDLFPEQKKKTETNVQSNLPYKIESLLEMICDQKRMEEIMKEMSYDSSQTPLGKLTLKQVKEGYIALNKVAAVLSSGKKGSALINACNDFYTKIPHNFGMKVPPVIQTQSEINEKLKMLEALMNITVAMSVLNSESNKIEHPLDKYYRSLDCCIELLNPINPEYMELEKCLKETHGSTHSTYEMEIIDAFKCYKNQEHSSFKNFGNNLLLWHGSRITNWLGILKEGLRIAPPEAPVSGYMFGKGLYFADVSSKSANYCFATKRKNEGLLLLCEVSVGNQYYLTKAEENMPLGLPEESNSVLGKGRFSPSSFRMGSLSSEAKIPCGPLIECPSYEGSLHYNEYIVYDVKQVKMKYIIRIKFNFK